MLLLMSVEDGACTSPRNNPFGPCANCRRSGQGGEGRREERSSGQRAVFAYPLCSVIVCNGRIAIKEKTFHADEHVSLSLSLSLSRARARARSLSLSLRARQLILARKWRDNEFRFPSLTYQRTRALTRAHRGNKSFLRIGPLLQCEICEALNKRMVALYHHSH